MAFANAGFVTTFLAESDPVAQKVLTERFPDATSIGDVFEVYRPPANIEIITAGFPCQNLSMAGDKSGIGGTKSGVVQQLFKLIERSKAETIVVENVYFMLHLDSGKAMNWLLDKFEELGFQWGYRVLDTAGFGLPQRRRRVYLVASRSVDPRGVLFADETATKEKVQPTCESPLGFYWTEGRSGLGITVDGIPPLKGGSGLGIPSAPAVLFEDGAVLMPSLSGCEKLQGFPKSWTSAADNVVRNPRWCLLGNAVSVPVATWVAKRIKSPGQPLDLGDFALENGSRWPDAAYGEKGHRKGVRASDKPKDNGTPSIRTYRDASWKPLSARALNGFIKRADEGNLRFPVGFLDALRSAHESVKSAA